MKPVVEIDNFPNGHVKCVSYYMNRNGILHRTHDKPARICYYENGNINCEEYYLQNLYK